MVNAVDVRGEGRLGLLRGRRRGSSTACRTCFRARFDSGSQAKALVDRMGPAYVAEQIYRQRRSPPVICGFVLRQSMDTGDPTLLPSDREIMIAPKHETQHELHIYVCESVALTQGCASPCTSAWMPAVFQAMSMLRSVVLLCFAAFFQRARGMCALLTTCLLGTCYGCRVRPTAVATMAHLHDTAMGD